MQATKYEKCIKSGKCSHLICSIFTSCYKKSRYDSTMLISFAIIEFIVSLIQLVLLGFFIARGKQNQAIRVHYKIFIVSFLALASRSAWYYFARYYYYANEPVQTQQVLNAISLTSMYIQQSFYVQSWLSIILLLNNMKGEKIVKIVFPITDFGVFITALTVIILRCLNGNEQQTNTSYYTVFCKFVAALNVALGIIFVVVGAIIFSKLRNYYKCFSRSVMSFLCVSVTFLALTTSRFVALIWQDVTNEYLEQNLFGALEYFIPDFVSTLVINTVQVNILISIQKKNKRNKSEEEDSLVDNRYF
ncbi:Transmembrane_domain-containing protein [Hexamita inflata]|uniref:Transmembrane_domain-containing protein n=1 Tax=Hexamita inflata TaxID=28002 RepID=A0ABP1HPJ9_9EUKA